AITHLKLLFVASAGYDFNALENCVGKANSNFCIDNVAFSYDNGLTEPLISSVKAMLYPNPSTDIVNFEFNKEVTGKLIIYDVTGAQIAEIPVQDMKTQVTTSELSNGHYFYRLIEGKTILSSGKFTVAK
ncbi:MAG: T9SS type A sorting domain-containing protein, partial [Bacteroidales bacterium]